MALAIPSRLPLLAVLALTVTARAQTEWLPARGGVARLGGLYQHSMAYDTARGRTVLFGGSTSGGPLRDETWEYDGLAWVQRTPWIRPPARSRAGMAFDPIRGRTVLFGGYSSTGYHGDTWEWNGTVWTQVGTAGPSPRTETGMVFDESTGKVVLFGGLSTPSFLDDLWEFDGAAWNLIQPTGPRPAGRSLHAMAYDATRGRLVLFGGRLATGVFDGETWEWDGAQWTRRFPATSPAPRAGAAMAYDPVRERVVLAGGGGASGSFNDTWEWDGNDWVRMTTRFTWSNRAGHAMVYDRALGRMVMHGPDTWYYGALVEADAGNLGTGCGGTLGVPVLTSTEPFLGNPQFDIVVTQARANAPAVLGVAFDTVTIPIGGGCSIYLRPYVFSFPFRVNGNSYGGIRMTIPADPRIRGLRLYAQAAIVDPLGPVGGLSFTAARWHVIGD